MNARGKLALAVIGVAALLSMATAGSAFAAPNAAPVITFPGTQSMAEDGTLTFSAGNLNSISVSDVDAGSAAVQVTLSGNFGKITLPVKTGLSFSSGDGTDDSTMTFTGTIASINTDLDGLQFKPDANHNDTNGSGTATLNIDVNDLGNTGDDGAKSDNQTVTINVSAVNDPPVNTIPTGIGTYENVDKVLSTTNANAIAVNDPDGPNNQPDLQVTLTATHGTITLGSTSGLNFSAGDGSGDAAMTFAGSLGNITVALNGLTFSPDTDFTGDASINIVSDDQGGTGPGGPLTDNDTLTIRVDQPEDSVYWAASKNTGVTPTGAIARADLDGDGGANLVTGLNVTQDIPSGVAIDVVGERIYWSNTPTSTSVPTIYSAKLDGTDVQQFLTSATAPSGTHISSSPGALVIDAVARRLYWSNLDNVTAANRGIYWAGLDNPTTGGAVVTAAGPPAGATVGNVKGFAFDFDNDQVYWTNRTGPSSTQSLAFASPSGSGSSGTFAVSGLASNDDFETPTGIAVDPTTNRLFWANNSGPSTGTFPKERLKVATLNGTSSVGASAFNIGNASGGGLKFVALDPAANRIYFDNTSSGGKVSFAALDGSGNDSGDLATGAASTTSPDGMVLLKHPTALTAPEISGTPEAGQTLTCGDTTWAADALNGGLYQMPKSTAFGGWTRDGNPIPGASSATYTPDMAGEYRCTRTATNFAGTTTSTSEAVTVVAKPTPPGTNPPAASSPPSSQFSLNPSKPKSGASKVTFTVDLPGAGELDALLTATSKLSRTIALGRLHTTVAGAGKRTVTVKLNGKARKALRKKRKLAATLKVTFKPTGGTAASKLAKLKLRG